jgi:deoxyxylulose-5-phosphate synthase
MTTLKTFIPKYRFEKFELRKWTITFNPKMQPVCYKSLFTQSFPIDPKDIDKICPIFHQKMVQGKNCKIIKIESLKNKGWDDAFEATQHWIINELERDARANNKPTNTINSNNRLLFHGTRTEEAADNIK